VSEHKLTEKQRAVLLGVYHCVNEHGRPAGEYRISREVIARKLWPDKDNGVYLHGFVKKLTDRGLLERHGTATNYSYTLTVEGRDAIA
jgi:RIO-like serine/threonine protein kinase